VSGPLAGVPLIDRDAIARKAELERRHWWYRGRRHVVRAALARLPLMTGREVLEVGCGTGHNLTWLSELGPARGIEVNPAAVEWARAAGHRVETGDLEALAFGDGEFGLLACLDVLEHVSDDAAALREMRRVTEPGGVLLITVPAYPSLFSAHDRAAGHRRRYSPSRLIGLTRPAGWEPVLQTNFNLVLLPVAVAARLVSRPQRASRPPRSDLLRTPAALDGVLQWPLRAEAAAVRAGLSLPAGLSILLALRAV
jgi:SAM-dependent methyltransferase